MPVQKRPFESTTHPSPSRAMEEEKADDSFQDGENHSRRQTETTCDSDDSPYSSSDEKDEFIVVKLGDIRKEVQCPICLGIIRKTRTVMECLHRFCRECIDKSMRLGNNECPACRTHCASRRSLRDDPNYDALIAALYPDIDKYEEEELAFHEEEKARNKQIQASIAQTFRRQAEALGKKRAAKVSAAAFVRRQSSSRNLRGRRNHIVEQLGSDEEGGGNGNDGSKDSSSTDERSPENKSKRQRRAGGARSSQKFPGPNANGDLHDNDSESLGASRGSSGKSEIVAWGRGGMRSNARHAGLSWTGIKLSRSDRLSNLVARLECLNDNEDLLKISLTLIKLLEDEMPPLKRPYLFCSPRLSVRHLCQYVAMQTSMEASNIELLIVKDFHQPNSNIQDYPVVLNTRNADLQLLGENQTLGDVHACFMQPNLGLAYRRKAYNTES